MGGAARDLGRRPSAILPVGATEQHGPHLGCGMDAVLADRLCAAVAARTRVPALPTLPYGCSLGHSRRWPGTIAVQPVTLIELVKQIGDWAYHAGVRRLFIVNTHVTNAAPLRCALEMLRAEHDDLMVALFNSATLSPRVRELHFADARGLARQRRRDLADAGGRARHGAPRFARRQPTIPIAPRAWFSRIRSTAPAATASPGRPSRATADNGRHWFDWMVEDLSELILRGMTETPPLDHSYFTTAELMSAGHCTQRPEYDRPGCN